MNNAVKIVTDALSSLTDLAIHLLVAGVIIGILFGDVFGVIGKYCICNGFSWRQWSCWTNYYPNCCNVDEEIIIISESTFQ